MRLCIAHQRTIQKDVMRYITRVALFVQGLEYHMMLNEHCDWIILLAGDWSILPKQLKVYPSWQLNMPSVCNLKKKFLHLLPKNHLR